MSLQLAIPRRVALQQSSPPLHQPSAILKEKRKFEKEKPLNCMCANSKLSQQRGSPHATVPDIAPNGVFISFACRSSFCSASLFICNFICEYFLKTWESPWRSSCVTHSSATPPALKRVAYADRRS